MKRGRKSWKEKLNEPIDYNYGTIYGKYSKYERGKVITDLDTLLEQKRIIFCNYCINQEWVRNQQVGWLLKRIDDKAFHKAKLKGEVKAND